MTLIMLVMCAWPRDLLNARRVPLQARRLRDVRVSTALNGRMTRRVPAVALLLLALMSASTSAWAKAPAPVPAVEALAARPAARGAVVAQPSLEQTYAAREAKGLETFAGGDIVVIGGSTVVIVLLIVLIIIIV